jgi:hypothetical protein
VRTRGALLLGAACALAAAPRALAEKELRLPGPATAQYVRGSRAAKDAECEQCHANAAREHGTTLHARAFSDASFQRGYAIEPKAFCRSCHAPESAPDVEPDAFARTHGVACVTCHVPDPAGPVLAAATTMTRPQAPHPLARVDGFGTRACASCHEFAFPNAGSLDARGLMQKTMTEHAASSAHDRSCTSCHMPRGERGRASHAVAASRDAALLSSSLAVRALREKDVARFELTAKDVGHAFPTGDLFRRLVLRVTTPRGTIERPLARTFRSQRAGGELTRIESSDERVAPTRQLAIALPPGEARWSVLYQRVTSVEQTPPFEAHVEDEVPLASGRL